MKHVDIISPPSKLGFNHAHSLTIACDTANHCSKVNCIEMRHSPSQA